MHPAANELTAAQPPAESAQWPTHPAIPDREPRNLILLATHQIVLRVGWIFKTESVIMPAFLDWLVGPQRAAVLRGCLPVLNRFGQSIPPVVCADALQTMRRKKLALAGCVMLMGLPFAVLAGVCLGTDPRAWGFMPALYLGLYGLFFVFNGLYQVSFGTVQGKLIRPTHRGRLLLVSTTIGTLPAMLFAWWLLDDWLELPDGGFGYVFAFPAVCFTLSGLTVLLLYEPADAPRRRPATRLRYAISETFEALRGDRNLRCLVVVAMLFGCALIVFPHYQTLACQQFELTAAESARYLMIWVLVQNAAVGAYSLFVGPLADAWGNRGTLRLLILGAATAPPTAVALGHLGPAAAQWYWVVFLGLAFPPLVLRILNNYALEICAPARHPRYLSTVSLCLAIPFLFSPGVGWLVGRLGFNLVLLTASGLIVLGALLTFRLSEPRQQGGSGSCQTTDAGTQS